VFIDSIVLAISWLLDLLREKKATTYNKLINKILDLV